MLKRRKFLTTLISCTFALGCNLGAIDVQISEQPRTKVFLTGNGIATRLHKPVLEEIPNVDVELVHISEQSPLPEDSVSISDGWLFLGTPVYKHKHHILCSCKKYKKILCEKPVGLSTDEINQIKDIINQNGILFRVNYALRFLPGLDEIKEFISNNDVKSVTLTCNAGFNKNPPNKAWKSDYKLGGGILYSILPHMVDLLNFLNCEEDLKSIVCKSGTKIPMDDIKLCSKTSNGVNMMIDINLCENFDEFTLKIETFNETRTFDLINSLENKISDTKYRNGTLSATSEVSPWRISFKHLLDVLFINPEDYRLAKIEDAEKVQNVLGVILSQQSLL